MAVIAALDVLFRGRTKDFDSKLSKSTKGVQKFERGVSKSSAAAASSFGGISTAATGLLIKLAPLIAAFKVFQAVKSGLTLAAEFETAQVAFATMLKDAGKANKLLADIQKFAASTPFQQADLRGSAQKLLAFGVEAKDVMGIIKNLGDVAAGSGANIADLTGIFGKTFATGKVELEQINQLAERGIPIYKVLKSQFGVTGAGLRKMISTGKIGFADLQTALQSMTNAGGIFEGSMAKQSQTVAGKWSTMKDNISLALQKLGTTIMSTFDIGAVIDTLTGWIQQGIDIFNEWVPVIVAWKDALVAQFNFVVEVVTTVVNAVLELFAPVLDMFDNVFPNSMGGWVETITLALHTVEFAFKNWKTLLLLAVDKAWLGLVTFVNDTKNFFLNVLPTIFRNFGTIVGSVFKNIWTNVKNFGKAIWKWIKSGFKGGFQFNWTPLTQGAETAIQEVKDSMKRAPTDYEKALADGIAKQEGKLKEDFNKFIESKVKKADTKAKQVNKSATKAAAKIKEKVKVEVKDTVKVKDGASPEALAKGSAAAFSAISQARKDNTNRLINEMKKQAEKQKDANDHLEKIAENTKPQLKVADL